MTDLAFWVAMLCLGAVGWWAALCDPREAAMGRSERLAVILIVLFVLLMAVATYYAKAGHAAPVVAMTAGTGAQANQVLVQVSLPATDPAPVSDVEVRVVVPAHTAIGKVGLPTAQRWQFRDTSSNTPTAWAWAFGDGGTSTIQNPMHDFARPGTYAVSLTASNAGGSNTLTKPGLVALPAWADPTITPTLLTLHFAGLAPGESEQARIAFVASG